MTCAATSARLPPRWKDALQSGAPTTKKRRVTTVMKALHVALGEGLVEDHNIFCGRVDAALKDAGTTAPRCRAEADPQGRELACRAAPPVIARVHKPGKLTADRMLGFSDAVFAGKACVVEFEAVADLRDTEQVPLLEEGGIEAFIRSEVLPYRPDTWINNDATRIGCEISFTRHFYKPQPLRTLAEISADILAIEKEAEGLLDGLLMTECAP